MSPDDNIVNIADARDRKLAADINELERLAENAVSPVTRNAILSLIQTYRLLGSLGS
jgi:hypothetical protein